MKNNEQLLKLYKEEKAMVIGSVHKRTGLETYPSFPEWKNDYITEYRATHSLHLTEKEAEHLMDTTVEQADLELSKMDVTFEATPVETPTRKKPGPHGPSTTKISKNTLASRIFAEHYGNVSRAVILARFLSELGLTANGASTYYQKFKKAADILRQAQTSKEK